MGIQLCWVLGNATQSGVGGYRRRERRPQKQEGHSLPLPFWELGINSNLPCLEEDHKPLVPRGNSLCRGRELQREPDRSEQSGLARRLLPQPSSLEPSLVHSNPAQTLYTSLSQGIKVVFPGHLYSYFLNALFFLYVRVFWLGMYLQWVPAQGGQKRTSDPWNWGFGRVVSGHVLAIKPSSVEEQGELLTPEPSLRSQLFILGGSSADKTWSKFITLYFY